MADRYADWHRQRNDAGTTSAQQAQGRKVLGLLMEELRLSGLPTGVKRWQAPDGTMYTASFDGTTPVIQIQTAGGTVTKRVLPPIDLWIPQGFVFTPGNDNSPTGFGLPVQVTQVSEDVFHPTNTNPGLDVPRWKAGGPCAQVLLTRQDTTDYPRAKKRRIPVGFDRQEWMAGAYTAPAFSAWHVVRPRFNDFSWSPDVMGARRDLWRALEAAQGKPVSLPFAGYYDDAQLIADLGNGYGTNPAMWPLAAYRTESQRATADGVPVAYEEAWTNGAAADLTTELGIFHDGVPALDAGVRAGLKVATLRTQDAWIHAGNQFWHPDDPGLPMLSWDGYPAQNLPFWLVEGGWVGDIGGAIFPLESWNYEWRGQTRYVYSKKLYAMGRCIGVLPDTVIAAAIRKETVLIDATTGAAKRVNRVVVITWRANDQFGDTNGIAYLWKFRVWCADFEVMPGVPLYVQAVPVDAYDAVANPTGWRLCGTFSAFAASGNTGAVPAGLPDTTVWQMWRFNGDGTRAVSACGTPPYGYDVQGPSRVCEAVFGAIGPDSLSCVTAQSDPAAPDTLITVDYAQGNAWAWVQAHILGGEPLTYRWSEGGAAHDTDFTGSERVVERWVLSARDGAMAFAGHFIDCAGAGLAAELSYKVRLVHRGTVVATDTWTDTAGVYEPERSSDNWLDRLNASYARDRDGHYVLGYDLGTTQGATTVYASWPVCGSPYPAATGATSSAHFGSRWISDVGDPAALAQFSRDMRAFPMGVC